MMKNSSSSSNFDTWKHYKYVIIDEKSMILEFFWKTLLAVKHSNPRVGWLSTVGGIAYS
jgi:hypothetical protein